MDKLLVASEYTDPCFHLRELESLIIHENKIANEAGYKTGMLLISKQVYGCDNILVLLNRLNIPTIIHSTNTGLSASIVEPKISVDWKTGLNKSIEAWQLYYPKSKFVLRIDPIIPYMSSEAIIYSMMQIAADNNITSVRFSIMDCYPFVRSRFNNKHLSVSPSFQYSQSVINTWINKIGEFATSFHMDLNVCAENIQCKVNCSTEGCASIKEWGLMGLNMKPATFKQRELCTCTAYKHELLKGRKCSNDCMYCYFSKERKD